MSKGWLPLECRLLTPRWKDSLLAFLKVIKEVDTDGFFNPHEFTSDAVDYIIRNSGKDLYYLLVEGARVIGYGMLRGWNEGYEVPSLGIAVHPDVRGLGVATFFMSFLSLAAKRSGAPRIRLRVNCENTRAIKLYKSLGYQLYSEGNGYLIGFLELCEIRNKVESESPATARSLI